MIERVLSEVVAVSELLELFKIEVKKFFGNWRFLLAFLLSPLLLAAVMAGIVGANMSSTASPVKVCAPPQYAPLVSNAGGELVTGGCEVSFSDPSTLYFTVDLYGNTNRVKKMESFASKFENEYFYSVVGTTPSVTRKSVLVIGSKEVVFNEPPSEVVKAIIQIVSGIPVAIFIALLIGNEYVSTYFTSQRDRKLLDLIASYPLRRRNIILSRILFGILFGVLSVVVFGAGMLISTFFLAAKYGASALGGATVNVSFPAWSIAMMLVDTFMVVVFTYFVSIAFALRSSDASETSITSMLVNFVLNFSLLVPSFVGSLGILKSPVVSFVIPTLVPLKVVVLGLEGNVLMAAVYSLYLAVVTAGMYVVVLKAFKRSFG